MTLSRMQDCVTSETVIGGIVFVGVNSGSVLKQMECGCGVVVNIVTSASDV